MNSRQVKYHEVAINSALTVLQRTKTVEEAAYDIATLIVMAHEDGKSIVLPDIEIVSAKVHEAWMQSKLAKGITSRKSETGEELMVPYSDLSEDAKNLDRGSVQAVYDAINSLL